MTFKNSNGLFIIKNLVKTIQDNKDYLSEIDGKIGDGDHGINMNKGFTLCGQKIEGRDYNMSKGFQVLGQTLLTDIGGSMGPLYGVFFDELATASEGYEDVDSLVFKNMITAACEAIQEIGNAKRGDKTLLDTLLPAIDAYNAAYNKGDDFKECLMAFQEEAKKGWQSTEDMIAKIGRASRLGERSRGVLDAGATSCYLIVNSIAESIMEML